MTQLLKVLFTKLYLVLPNSPFSSVADGIREFEFLPFLNWFIPFDRCLEVTALWCVMLAAVYNFDFLKDIVRKIKDAFFG
ncbi:MAG: hypothetical protein K1W41_15365 [Lachnospiraceae bacterium]